MGCCTNYKRIPETSVGNVQEIHFHFLTDYTEVVFFFLTALKAWNR